MWSSVDRRLERHGADVYRVYSSDDALLYVGCSIDAYTRIGQHKKYSGGWFAQMARFTVTRYASRRVALAIEAKAINDEQPLYNGMPGWRAPADVIATAEAVVPIRYDNFVLETVGVYA